MKFWMTDLFLAGFAVGAVIGLVVFYVLLPYLPYAR